jgi:predicted DNA-binding transcriptional regulator AlpA
MTNISPKIPDNSGVVRLVLKPEVLDRVNVTYPTLWQWMREGKFPRSRKLGGKVAWVEREINEWILARPLCRLKGDNNTEAHPTPAAT